LSAFETYSELYTYVNPQVVFITTALSFVTNVTTGLELYSEGLFDLLIVDEPVPLMNHFIEVPLFVGALALVYSPSVSPLTLNFSREAVALIWLGRITNWNDSLLTILNPNAVLPSDPITVVWFPYLGVTKTFIQGLASFMDDIEPVIAAQLRANQTLEYLAKALGSRAVAMSTTGAGLELVGSRDSMAFMYLINDASYRFFPTANMINRASK